jgi:hypothetical protein
MLFTKASGPFWKVMSKNKQGNGSQLLRSVTLVTVEGKRESILQDYLWQAWQQGSF